MKRGIKDKKAVSTMLSYIMLIGFVIAMSIVIFQNLKTYVPINTSDCPDDTLINIKEAVCKKISSIRELNLTFSNIGRFNIAGFYIHASNKSNGFKDTDISSELIESAGGKVLGNTVLFSLSENNTFKPAQVQSSLFNLSEDIFSVEVIPFRFQEKNNKKETVICSNSRVSMEVDCSFKPMNIKSLVSWYKFNDTTDSIGNNDGTLKNNAHLVNDFERGWVVQLDGEANGAFDYVDLGNDMSLHPSSFSFLAWVYQTGTHGTIIGFSEKNNNFEIDFKTRSPGNQLKFSTHEGSIDATKGFDNLVWTHLALTYNGTSGDVAFYINGSDAGSGILNSPIPTFNFEDFSMQIGLTRNNNHEFKGLIDEVMIFNDTLTSEEVLELYNSF